MVEKNKLKSSLILHQKSPKPAPPSPSPSTTTTTTTTTAKPTLFNRSYFPRSSAQVQPKPSDISHLLKLIEHLHDRESKLKTQLIEQKLLIQAASFVPSLEAQLNSAKHTSEQMALKLHEIQLENEKLVREREVLKNCLERERREKDLKIHQLLSEIEELRSLSASQRLQGLIEVSGKSNLIKNLSFRKINNNNNNNNNNGKLSSSSSLDESNKSSSLQVATEIEMVTNSTASTSSSSSLDEVSSVIVQARVPRVPKPPPLKRTCSDGEKSSKTVAIPAPPPLPPPVSAKKLPAPPPPPLPPPMAAKGVAVKATKVKRVPEVVEFYHSLMRRDSRRDNGGGTAEVTSTSAKDLVGEIENRSAYLLAIKTDVETQGEFIRFLIKEVENASFTDIEDVVSFVKWLDDELTYLVDERAVLKHFDWPEQKADALREAAFEYSDLKKLEFEASSFRDVARQACSITLKKMQTLLEKLEHRVYNLSRLRESATNRFKSFHIPVDWMLDTGFVSQIKLASVKLAMKYMKRVSLELEGVGSGLEEQELIVQGVRFAFRVHQFAGGFDVETMRAFEELRDKARSCHVQFQKQQQTQLPKTLL